MIHTWDGASTAGRRAESRNEAEAAEGNSGGRAGAEAAAAGAAAADAIPEWPEEAALESDWVPGSNSACSSRLEDQLHSADAPSAPSGSHPPHSGGWSCSVATVNSAPDYYSDSRGDLSIQNQQPNPIKSNPIPSNPIQSNTTMNS